MTKRHLASASNDSGFLLSKLHLWPLGTSTLPLEGGEWNERSGELLLSAGETVCLRSSLPSEPFPPGLAGLEHRDVVAPALLPADGDEEEEAERVGLCWSPRRSWKGTVARTGCSRTAVLVPPQEAGGEPLCLSRCEDEPRSALDSDIISLLRSLNKPFLE